MSEVCSINKCGRPVLQDPDADCKCILHAPLKEKDLVAFQAAIDDITQNADANKNTCNFSHVHFPIDYEVQPNLNEALKHNCNFNHAVFSGTGDFSSAEFGGYAYFSSAEFGGDASFESAEFGGDAYFESAKFGGYAYFSSAEFGGDAYFESAKFGGDAYFESAKFGGYAYFESAKFGGYADFSSAEFGGDAYFESAKFGGYAYFESAKFGGYAYFSSAEFGGDAYFESAKFGGYAYFSSAKFGGYADFESAKFGGDAYFSSAKFGGYAYFESAKFGGDADFSSTIFEQFSFFGWETESETAVKNTTFKAKVDFKDAVFKKLTRFINTKIHHGTFSGASFTAALFKGVATIPGKNDELPLIDFTYVPFNEGQHVSIHNCKADNWRFEGTDLTKIDFHNIDWVPHARKFMGFKMEKHKGVQRENALKSIEKTGDRETLKSELANLQSQYRQLKLNYHATQDFRTADQFYTSEMDMRRRKHRLMHPKRWSYSLYRLLSVYGESYGRALLLLSLFILGFTLVLVRFGYTEYIGSKAIPFPAYCIDYSACWPSLQQMSMDELGWRLQHASRSITIFGRPNLVFNTALKSNVAMMLSLFGAAQLGFFVLALRRRFRR